MLLPTTITKPELRIKVPGCGRVPATGSHPSNAQYYSLRDKLPKKYRTPRYKFRVRKGQPILFDTKHNEPVSRESKVKPAGDQIISGQLFYSGIHHLKRTELVTGYKATLVDLIHASFIQCSPPPFPWKVRVELHRPAGAANWDVDNCWILTKCFLDLIQQLGYLPNDNIQFITRAGEVRWVEAGKGKEEETHFIITADVQ